MFSFQVFRSFQAKGDYFVVYQVCAWYVLMYLLLKDKSGVGIIVDYSRDYTVVNGV